LTGGNAEERRRAESTISAGLGSGNSSGRLQRPTSIGSNGSFNKDVGGGSSGRKEENEVFGIHFFKFIASVVLTSVCTEINTN